jgi:hypothetical protein
MKNGNLANLIVEHVTWKFGFNHRKCCCLQISLVNRSTKSSGVSDVFGCFYSDLIGEICKKEATIFLKTKAFELLLGSVRVRAHWISFFFFKAL